MSTNFIPGEAYAIELIPPEIKQSGNKVLLYNHTVNIGQWVGNVHHFIEDGYWVDPLTDEKIDHVLLWSPLPAFETVEKSTKNIEKTITPILELKNIPADLRSTVEDVTTFCLRAGVNLHIGTPTVKFIAPHTIQLTSSGYESASLRFNGSGLCTFEISLPTHLSKPHIFGSFPITDTALPVALFEFNERTVRKLSGG